MKLFQPIASAAATGLLVLVLASPLTSFARDQEHPGPEHRQISPEKRAQWAQKHLDREAAMLEIKASQEPAWKAYAAASVDMVTAIGDTKPLPHDADAAAIVHQHADRAALMAQNLAKLADATDKLQAVLGEDQRRVLNRIVRHHQAQFHAMHHGRGGPQHGGWQGHEQQQRGPGAASDAANPAVKPPVPANTKN
jgi:hypothetical protein